MKSSGKTFKPTYCLRSCHMIVYGMCSKMGLGGYWVIPLNTLLGIMHQACKVIGLHGSLFFIHVGLQRVYTKFWGLGKSKHMYEPFFGHLHIASTYLHEVRGIFVLHYIVVC